MVGLLVVLAAVAALLVRSSETSAAPNTTTTVSFTFDDGRTSQYPARGPLAAHGMRGTFYVNSGLVAPTPGGFYMTWAQLHDLAADGNEITGHSLTHQHLTRLSTDALRHEICDDRTNLLNNGFSPVLSFAYPYAEYNSTVESMVSECGYLSGRTVGGIRAGNQCGGCPFAETLPPLDPYATRTPGDISTSTPLATMQSYVTQAEQNGGGWVQFVFHDVNVSQLTAFLDWLQPRAANGTVVRTVYEAMTGAPPPPPPPPGPDTTAPVTTIACNATTCTTGWYSSAVTITLSASDVGGSGVAATRYTTDGTDPTTDSTVYTSPFSVMQTTTVKFRSWDNAGNVEVTKAQAIQVDTAPPGVSITEPAEGSIITSGNEPVVADATDAVSGIRQVAFFVDGTPIGTDTSAPYRVRWRTRNSGNGQHVLTAVATDVAGNSATSPPVTVTVR